MKLTPIGLDESSLNVDGEILPGPGPFTVSCMPSFLVAYGEY